MATCRKHLAKLKDNTRPFFRFDPLVSKADDAYKKLLSTAKAMSMKCIEERGIPITVDLYDLILFLVRSLVRLLSAVFYALTHGDVMVADDPRRMLTIRDTQRLVARICAHKPNRKLTTLLLRPQYAKRTTAGKVFQQQFNALLNRAGLEVDP